MISVEEALERILGYVERLGPEERPVLGALGQVLAEDVIAEFNIPLHDNTAVDGYAVRAADTAGATPSAPRTLPVIGELAAGYLHETPLPRGAALRIMTGAPTPPDADAVVPFEETDEASPSTDSRQGLRPPGAKGPLPAEVRVFKEAQRGANIRRHSEDVRASERVLSAGTVIRPGEAGVLASLGRATVPVIRRPVVAILSTGDEIVPLGEPLTPGKIYDANATSIAAMVQQFGGIPNVLGIARDRIDDLTAHIHSGLDSDLLVTSAGVSRGDYDIVKDVLANEGEIAFWTVAMKPGKPLAFGAFLSGGRRVPHIGLPGNPVSAMVSFELFGRPAIAKMAGKLLTERPRLRAVALDRIENRADPRRFYARCRVEQEEGRWVARLTGPQGSGILTSMAFANALTVIPEEVDVIEPGEEIDVIMLDWSPGE